jgi:hypothetical protein
MNIPEGYLFMTPEELEKPLVDSGISRNHSGMLDLDVLPAEVSHYPARLPNEQASGSDVPDREVLLPKAIETTCRHVGQVERCRSRATNAAYRCGNATELTLVFRQPGLVFERKARSDKRELRFGDCGYVQPAAAQPGATPTARGVALVPRHMPHYTGFEYPVY